MVGAPINDRGPMIRNGKDIPDGSEISTTVCVIGSGPAGITAAWYLQKAGLKVTLIEGSRDFRHIRDEGNRLEASYPDKVRLYNGKADGQFAGNEPEFLINRYAKDKGPQERERVFGGTSTHWSCQCRPLDPITFEKRPGFPGWPISRADLEPYYAKAAALLGLNKDFTIEYWAKILQAEMQAEVPHLAGFDTEMYQWVPWEDRDFAKRKFERETTIGNSKAEVILNASLLEIDHAQGTVRSVRVASMDDQSKRATEFTIKASAFVLACGAVANARQLLLSNAGNEHDQIGRHFIGHPVAGGVVSITGSYLNEAEKRAMAGGGTDEGYVQGRFSPNADQQRTLQIGGCWFDAGSTGYYFEMAPNPDSRVRLADTRDEVFGQPQTHITWELSPRDEETYKQTTRLFGDAVKERGAEASFAPWETVRKNLVFAGHHIGTTRMSAEPKEGVVDANLKVHSLDNLYVAGSSVFAAAGISNPTFTIVTLSIRLAEHLIKTIGK